MAEVKIDAVKRASVGKGSARQARAAGKVPGIVYGRGGEAVPIEINRRELITAFHTDAGMNVLLDLSIDGETTLAIARELQRDPVRGTLLHADFIRIDRKQSIDVDVPIHLVGEAAGVKEGGVLEQPLFQLSVRCIVTNVPEGIDADVSRLGVGDQLRVAELTVPEDVEVLTDPETVVAGVATPISEEELAAMEAAVGAEEPEEGAEPEEEAAEAAAEAQEEGATEEGGAESEAPSEE